MAWDFAAQMHALTGYDADSTSDSETGEDFNVLANQWLTDAAKEIVGVLPHELQEKCLVSTVLTNTNTTFDFTSVVDGAYKPGKLVAVTRSDGTYDQICREVSSIYASKVQDSNDMMYYATSTDPIYYVKSDTLHVYPTPTASQNAEVFYLSNPIVTYDDDSIINFPSEAERLVVLRASMKSALDFNILI